jgi:hypothetical protein
MAQKILIRRGGIGNINGGGTVAVTQGELLYASGSVVNTSVGDIIFISNATGNNHLIPAGRLFTGTASPTSFDSRLSGLPYFKTDENALFRIGDGTALDLTGNINNRTLTGVTVSGSFSGSFQGDFAGSINSASFASTASLAFTAISASFASTAATASFSVTTVSSSHADNAISASFASNAATAATATSASAAVTASYAHVAQLANIATSATSASYAATATSASFASNAAFATSASAAVTSSYAHVAQLANTATSATSASYAATATSASAAISSSVAFRAVSASFASNAAFATSASATVTSSYAHTAQLANTATTANSATSASFASSGTGNFSGSFSGSFQGDGSQLSGIATTLTISGSTGNGTVNLKTQALTITGDNGIQVDATGQTFTIDIPSDLTVPQNLTVGGNLDVKGTMTYISSSTVVIGDNIIQLNSFGAAVDGGIIVLDASGSFLTGSLLWNSADDYWYGGISGSTQYRFVTYDSQSPTTNAITKVDSNKRLVASNLLDTGTAISASAPVSLAGNKLTDADTVRFSGLSGSSFIYTNASKELAAIVPLEADTMLMWTGTAFTASRVLDGGTF